MLWRFAKLHKQFFPLLLLGFTLIFQSQQANSQAFSDPRTGAAEPPPAATGSGSDTTAALLRELETMKQRITEIEAQLKARRAANTVYLSGHDCVRALRHG